MPWTMPMTGTALKSVVRFSTEQTSSRRKETASGTETRRRRRRAEAVLMSTGHLRWESDARAICERRFVNATHKRPPIVAAARGSGPGARTEVGPWGRIRVDLRLRALFGAPVGRYLRPVAMFRLQGSKVLAVDMTGDAVKAKNGSMVAYDGQMAFKKITGGGEGLRGHGHPAAHRRADDRDGGEGARHLLVRRPRHRDQPGRAAAATSCTSSRATCCAPTPALRTGTTLHRAARRLAGQRPVHDDRRGARPGGDHVRRPGGGAARQRPVPADGRPGRVHRAPGQPPAVTSSPV